MLSSNAKFKGIYASFNGTACKVGAKVQARFQASFEASFELALRLASMLASKLAWKLARKLASKLASKLLADGLTSSLELHEASAEHWAHGQGKGSRELTFGAVATISSSSSAGHIKRSI